MARAAAESGRPKARGGPKSAVPLRARARSFAFEGFPEKDRFGVFDPALRGSFLLGVGFGAVFGAGSVLDAWGKSAGPVAAAVAVAFSAVVLGLLAYRRVWKPPAERELLLRMAREDDEARSEREARARGPAGRQ